MVISFNLLNPKFKPNRDDVSLRHCLTGPDSKHLSTNFIELICTSTSIMVTTEIGLNLHFMAGIVSVNFGNLKSKGQIYTDVQNYIEDNSFFTAIHLDYFFYIFLEIFLFPSALAILRLFDGRRGSVASWIFGFFSRKMRALVNCLDRIRNVRDH